MCRAREGRTIFNESVLRLISYVPCKTSARQLTFPQEKRPDSFSCRDIYMSHRMRTGEEIAQLLESMMNTYVKREGIMSKNFFFFFCKKSKIIL